MTDSILEKYEALVIDMANMYLSNMAWELGIKYKDTTYAIKPRLSDSQHTDLKSKHKISGSVFSNVYSEFQKMEPTSHLMNAMNAFSASGGNIDIEPKYDDKENKLNVTVKFSIKDKVLEKIEGLTPIEDVMLRMTAMRQIDSLLSEADPNSPPSF
tara:strand:+ start:3861 stop:4328 length:468 start_codon:yes stop_codon:yes gene_type:complete